MPAVAIGIAILGAGTSAVVAGALGGAIIGAVVGGVMAAVTGGNILEGALKGGVLGAVGGAIGGYLQGAEATGAISGPATEAATTAETASITSGAGAPSVSALNTAQQANLAAGTGASITALTTGPPAPKVPLTTGEKLMAGSAVAQGIGSYLEGEAASKAAEQQAATEANMLAEEKLRRITSLGEFQPLKGTIIAATQEPTTTARDFSKLKQPSLYDEVYKNTSASIAAPSIPQPSMLNS